MTPPCAGRSALFDSTFPTDHAEAAAICRACPLIDGCRELLAETRRAWGSGENYGPRGTWAGELIGKTDPLSLGARDPRRIAAEDAMFTPTTARAAHAAYQAGDRSDHTRLGERYYQRHRKRMLTTRRQGVAA